MASKIILQPISPGADASAIASCNARSFWDDTHWRHQWGVTSMEKVVADTAKRTPLSLNTGRDEKRYLKAIDSESRTLVGYARWILPHSLVGEICWDEAFIAAPNAEEKAQWEAMSKATLNENGKSQGLNFDMVRSLGGGMAAGDKRTRQKYSSREFLELDYVAVHQDWQGKGIGKMLVRRGIEEAKRLKLNYLIMAFTPSGKMLYDSILELTREEEVIQSCERWPEGRQDGCACIAAFYVWIFDEHVVVRDREIVTVSNEV